MERKQEGDANDGGVGGDGEEDALLASLIVSCR
jgi:hypothetical protein